MTLQSGFNDTARQTAGQSLPIALTIAGSDSGGGAGIQADLKTFQQFGVFGTSAVVAITAQNTQGVLDAQPVASALVASQLQALAEDLAPSAVKSGMLATSELVAVVSKALTAFAFPNYVCDPVMVATSGDRLLDADAEKSITELLLPQARVVTPNLHEAAILTGAYVDGPDDMERAGKILVELGAKAALVKGGHLPGDEIVDVLVTRADTRRFIHPRIPSASTHGTGCTLSAAIVGGLAHGRSLEHAVTDALDYVHRAIRAAPHLGSGPGPLNHSVPGPGESA